jgi:hypothetical protein
MRRKQTMNIIDYLRVLCVLKKRSKLILYLLTFQVWIPVMNILIPMTKWFEHDSTDFFVYHDTLSAQYYKTLDVKKYTTMFLNI